MTKGKFFWILLIWVVVYGCKDDFDKYERPEWLNGKVYTELKTQEHLQMFARCIEKVGYDKIIDVSGSYTVFAPSDDAFELYFANHPVYKKLEDIPDAELLKLVKFHIVQNPWSRQQLRMLDINGWIDSTDIYNDKPRGFKRETLLEMGDIKCGLEETTDDNLIIVDTTQSAWHRKVLTDSRKYAPIFYKEYFSIYNLQLNDYSFYFNRPFDDPDDLYYVGAKILDDELFAENGFIYTIDRVVEPLLNGNEILRSKQAGYNYSDFLNVLNRFPSFSYNEDETFKQPGADEGLVVDSLFDLSYPSLAFNINTEITKSTVGGSNSAIRFHHGLMAPTNEAFSAFVDQYIHGNNQWRNLDNVPEKVKKIIVNSYLSTSPVYASDIDKGFYNGESDVVRINTSDIIQKQFGSNCTFIGLSSAIIPRAFKSVTGPVYRQPGFSTVMNAIEYSGLLSALKREGQDYMLFAVPDVTLKFDSSLIYIYYKYNNQVVERFTAYTIFPSEPKSISYSKNDIRLLLLNQVAVERPRYTANKEFLQNLAGNYLIWDNAKGTVSGTEQSTVGLTGPLTNIEPIKISNDTDNGDTYQASSWFKFKAREMYSTISSSYPDFQALISKAGLALPKEYKYTFVSENQFYTVFVPTKAALEEVNAANLTGDELKRFVMLHFIQGNLIFTDGKLSEGYYETACVLPAANGVAAHNAKVYIKPGSDKIEMPDQNGNIFLTVNESSVTNLITVKSLSTNSSEPFIDRNTLSNGVIHEVSKAFVPELMDVK